MEFSGVTQDLGSLKNNVALNAFRIAVVGSLAGPQKYDAGFLDEFEDESGMDTGSCVSQSYDSTNDLYKGSFNVDLATGGTVLKSDQDAGNPATNAFDNNTGTRWVSSANITANVSYIGYHLPAAAKINKLRVWPNGGGANPVQIKIQYSDDGAAWNTLTTETCPSVGGAWTELSWINETESHAYWRLLAADSVAATWGIYEIEFIRVGTGFTLISQNVTAESNDPIKGRVILLVDYNGETITLNTDLLAYISIDDGSNFDQVSLIDGGLYDTDKHILSGDVVITARTDKEVVLKLVGANSKDFYLEAWAAFWEY
uniref:F5/8 type C domain-containing protein n=1 Tax=viral metagenome TaxID=1070528 RepID=A0A6H1Z720_9ZZZZ